MVDKNIMLLDNNLVIDFQKYNKILENNDIIQIEMRIVNTLA